MRSSGPHLLLVTAARERERERRERERERERGGRGGGGEMTKRKEFQTNCRSIHKHDAPVQFLYTCYHGTEGERERETCCCLRGKKCVHMHYFLMLRSFVHTWTSTLLPIVLPLSSQSKGNLLIMSQLLIQESQ